MSTKEEITKALLNYIEKKKVNKNLLLSKNISILCKQEMTMSQIQDNEPEDSQIIGNYEMMIEELKNFGYSDFRFLGAGAQGSVVLAKQNGTKIRHAIKGIRIRNSKGGIIEKVKNECDAEIKMLKQCSGSPYTLNLISVIEGKSLRYLVLSECQGTLQDLVKQQPNKILSELSAIKYSKDIAEGLLFIHSKGYIVQDLKLDNILIDYNNNAVVADLGLGQKMSSQVSYGLDQYAGNWLYSAPEVFPIQTTDFYKKLYDDKKIEISGKPSQRSDAFSLGYMIFSLIFGENKLNNLFKKHESLQFTNYFNNFVYKDYLKDIIVGLTQFNPRQRKSIQDVLFTLKGIVSYELNLESQLSSEMIGDISIINKYFSNEIEIIQHFSNSYFPIIPNEDQFIEQLNQNSTKSSLIEYNLQEKIGLLKSQIDHFNESLSFEDISEIYKLMVKYERENYQLTPVLKFTKEAQILNNINIHQQQLVLDVIIKLNQERLEEQKQDEDAFNGLDEMMWELEKEVFEEDEAKKLKNNQNKVPK